MELEDKLCSLFNKSEYVDLTPGQWWEIVEAPQETPVLAKSQQEVPGPYEEQPFLQDPNRKSLCP